MGADSFSWIVEGILGGMARPGSLVPLAEDLRDLRERHGISVLISLTERPLDDAVVAAEGMMAFHLPIPDFTAPAPDVIQGAVDIVQQAHSHGNAVAVHCAAGIGRTGTILACILVAGGHPPAEAIHTVRRLRPGSIETASQEQAVHDYSARLGG